VRFLNAEHPQIMTWIAMAEAAIDEMEKLQELDDLEED
jgi:hypothetical protein